MKETTLKTIKNAILSRVNLEGEKTRL